MRQVGIGLRPAHAPALLAAPPPLAFVEVHSENYFGAGGAALGQLMAARQHWPVSLHGVGLGLGSAAGLDATHLERLAALVQRVEPVRISDHACFARAPHTAGGATLHANDLLPIAFTAAALDIIAANVQRVQDRLHRPLLVENLTAYLHWTEADFSEPEFFNQLTRRTGCGLLLDVNNLVVNALNEGRRGAAWADGDADADATAQWHSLAVAAAQRWIDTIDPASVGEIHLAGYLDTGSIVIDEHGSRVHAPVWQVYTHAVACLGPRPTLVEWDTHLPDLSVLLTEAETAEALLRQHAVPKST